MVIIKVQGGLGNQLQQYALYEKFKSLGTQTKLDMGWYEYRMDVKTVRKLELKLFEGIQYDICSEEERLLLLKNNTIAGKIIGRVFPGSRHYYQESDSMYDEAILQFKDMYLDGYWSCEKYYHDIMPMLQAGIRFPERSNETYSSVKAQIEESLSISIHIRRGDYLNPENRSLLGGICTEEYYNGALCRMKERYPKAHYFVFSDDIPFAMSQYRGSEYTVVDCNQGVDSFYDMYLMSLCRHNICANSTFSFWGARLNLNPSKVIIRPLKHKNTLFYDPVRMHDLWPGFTFLNESGQEV